MKRFSVFTVLVNGYGDITRLLKKLEGNYKRSSIFISGSAEVFGSSKPHEAQAFIHDLSKRLSSARNRIITGFGLGVGSAVINGTLSYLNEIGKTISDEDVVMRPFPQVATGELTLKDQWTAYRKAMLEHAGIAVFLYGNKIDGAGVIVPANGMREEFEIAWPPAVDGSEDRVKVLPIGATGFMAEELWKEVKADFKNYFPEATPKF